MNARLLLVAALSIAAGALWNTRLVVADPPRSHSGAASTTEFATNASPRPPTDALGDPLPEGARLRFGTLRFRPASYAHELALSPDEKTVVTFGKELFAWDGRGVGGEGGIKFRLQAASGR